MKNHELIQDISDYALFLTDESRLNGIASTISFPENADGIASVCKSCFESGTPVTVQGSRTGIVGGAVPQAGHVLSLCRMKKIKGLAFDPARNLYKVTVEPGLTLSELREQIAKKSFDTSGWSVESIAALEGFSSKPEHFFPPDPTEATASIGGMAGTNASGARSFGYGPTRAYIEGLAVVLADGRRTRLARGSERTIARRFSVGLEDGTVIEGSVPSYRMPGVKNAAGYFAQDGMDLVDLFIGSEGTLGVIAELELALVPKPKEVCGVTVFLAEESEAIRLVKLVRGDAEARLTLRPAAIEYFDGKALRFLDMMSEKNEAFSRMPAIPRDAGSAVYAEIHANTSEEIDCVLGEILAAIEECGGSEEMTWLACGARDLETITSFRHALPEAVNMYVAELKKEMPGVTKLGTDMSVPDANLEETYRMYVSSLMRAKLDSVIFGHIGANHLHVNILPRSREEFDLGKAIYAEWAKRVVAIGGSVSAEHGIGKIKVQLLEGMYGEEGIKEMRTLKELFDPRCILGRGNMFEQG